MKVDILAIGVHPDDVELSCSGTLAKHIAMGKTAGILDLSRGELGTRGNADLRTKEATASAKLLGVSFRTQLNFKDGFFSNDESHQREIISVIRRHQPDIVLCNAINDRHPDHGRAAKLAADACFYSGLAKIETVDEHKAQTSWRPKAVYHYVQDHFIHPDFVIDITDHFETKLEALLKHQPSQFDQWDPRPMLEQWSGESGKVIGVKYAETFRKFVLNELEN